MALTIEIIRIWIWRTRASRLQFFRLTIAFLSSKALSYAFLGQKIWCIPPGLTRNRDTISFFPLFCIESRSRYFSCINIFEYPSLFWLLVFRKSGISKQAKKRNYKEMLKYNKAQHCRFQMWNPCPNFLLSENLYMTLFCFTLFTESIFRNMGSLSCLEKMSVFSAVHSSR